jgi:brefeldin A-inhibited guanine nucleotide-exchange protein
MLHTNVKQRMTLDQFVVNNRGIDGGKDLPYGFLETLYKGITSEKINLPVSSLSHTSLLTQAQRADLYKLQSNQTLQPIRERTTVGSDTCQFHRAKSANFVGPMFQSVWGIIAALTNSFYATNDMETIRLYLKGFQFSMHLRHIVTSTRLLRQSSTRSRSLGNFRRTRWVFRIGGTSWVPK